MLMMQRFRFLALVIAMMLCLSQSSRSADHVDGPAASADPAADITDVFAWMAPDAQRVFLVMNLTRNATTASKFSDRVQYVFHTTSRPSFGASPSPEVAIICTFNQAQIIQCWAGNDAYVTGDASTINGIVSDVGKLHVFAGLRNDPFFFNLAGFRATSRTVAEDAASLQFDPAGCPLLDNETAAELVTQLATAPHRGPAVNNVDRFNALSIVIALDKSIVTKNGPILSVWGSTNRP